MTTKQIKNEWNRKAEELGCVARIAGNKKSPSFEMWTGSVTSDGYEVVVKIDANKFGQLISRFPELH